MELSVVQLLASWSLGLACEARRSVSVEAAPSTSPTEKECWCRRFIHAPPVNEFVSRVAPQSLRARLTFLASRTIWRGVRRQRL